MAAFGYHRDGKKGQRQIVIGLWCDDHGTALSIEGFPGNTADTQTFGHQVTQVAQRFGGGAVTLVGDRGMLKGPQIEELSASKEHEFHYITALTQPPIETLRHAGEIQMGVFDQALAEVQTADGVRYGLRRHPTRAAEMQRAREDNYRALGPVIEEHHCYRQEHPRATLAVARRHIEAQSHRLKITDWVILTAPERPRVLSKNTDPLQPIEPLDGCYILKTDLSPTAASKELIHERYQALALVEWAFRTRKTVQVEMRPI